MALTIPSVVRFVLCSDYRRHRTNLLQIGPLKEAAVSQADAPCVPAQSLLRVFPGRAIKLRMLVLKRTADDQQGGGKSQENS